MPQILDESTNRVSDGFCCLPQQVRLQLATAREKFNLSISLETIFRRLLESTPLTVLSLPNQIC